MTKVTWAASVNGLWSDDGKWSPSPPGTLDDVTIGFASGTTPAFVVTADVANVTINSLKIDGDETATGGTHAAALAMVGNTLTVGTLTLNNNLSLISGFGLISVFNKINDLDVNGGTITASGGVLTLAGAGVLTAGLALAIDTASPSTLKITMQGGATLSQPITINNANQTFEIGLSSITINNNAQVITEGTIKLGGGSLIDTSGLNIGTNADLIGFGTIKTGSGKNSDLEGLGAITASGGVMEILTPTNQLAGGTTFHIANTASSVLKFDDTVGTGAVSVTVMFDTSAFHGAGTLNLTATTLAGFHAVVDDFVVGTKIQVLNADHVTLTGSTTLNVFNASNASLGSISLADSHAGASFFVDTATDSITTDFACYARGTMILTPDGEQPVDALRPGQLVTTLVDGVAVPRPVKWVGHRRIDLTRHPRAETMVPIRIVRGAFADNVPHRDLLLSPDHAVFTEGMLICVRQLVNGATIRRETGWTAVDYYHVELDQHAILLAEGLTAESYLDTGNRAFFANSGMALLLHPNLPNDTQCPARETNSCAPFVSGETGVRPVWQGLAERAAAIGRAAPARVTTMDASPRLRCSDGRTIEPTGRYDDRLIFTLPGAASEVRLVSRAQAPTEARPWLNDPRRLGVRVKRIVLRGADQACEVPMDHPGFARGWWEIEHDGPMMSRWTDGEAVLPLPPVRGPAMLEIHLAGAMTYVDGAVPGLAA